VALAVAILFGLLWLFAFSALTLFNPVLDSFAFRQTQTAFSGYSILHDHVCLAYLTPVLVLPGRFRTKLPSIVYQAMVAVFTSITRLDLDASGRLVSLAFFLGTVACGYKLVDRASIRPEPTDGAPPPAAARAPSIASRRSSLPISRSGWSSSSPSRALSVNPPTEL
jgi:hypothetical protein